MRPARLSVRSVIHMAERSTKPYLIRAIHEWCSDCNLTAYLSVRVDANTRVPAEYVKNGEIVLKPITSPGSSRICSSGSKGRALA